MHARYIDMDYRICMGIDLAKVDLMCAPHKYRAGD